MGSLKISWSKFAASICYIGIVIWLLALLIHIQHKSRFSAFHLRQALGLHICSVIIFFLIASPLGGLLAIVLFVYVLIGIFNAMQGIIKPLPGIGEFFDDKLKTIIPDDTGTHH